MASGIGRKRTVRGNQAAVLIALVVVGWYGPGVSMGTSKPLTLMRPAQHDVSVVKVPSGTNNGVVKDHKDRPYRQGKVNTMTYDVLELAKIEVAIFRMPALQAKIRGIAPMLLGCTEAVEDWLHVPAVIRTVQLLFQKNILPVVLHMPTGPGAGEGNCTRIPSSVLGQAMAELRSLMLPDHKGDGLPAYYLGAGDGATNLWVFGRDLPAAVAGLALFKPANSPIVLSPGYVDKFAATAHLGVVVTRQDELKALPNKVRGYLATPIAVSEGFFMQSLSLIDYACALEFTKPLLKYLWENHLVGGHSLLAGDGTADSAMLHAVVAGQPTNPRMKHLLERYEKQMLHLLAETRGLDGGVLSVPTMRQVLEWTTLN